MIVPVIRESHCRYKGQKETKLDRNMISIVFFHALYNVFDSEYQLKDFHTLLIIIIIISRSIND